MKNTFLVLSALLLTACPNSEQSAYLNKPVAQRRGQTRWIEYAGHQFRVSNVLEAELGKYGYKIKGTGESSFHAEGDLPAGVKFKTSYPLDVTYDSAHSLNKLGVNVPLIAGGSVSGGTSSEGSYKLYVLKAADEQDWKRLIRKGITANDEDLIIQLRRKDGYFRFVDAVLLVSDATAKQRLDAKLSANATYKVIRAELDASSHSGRSITGREPRVIGYSLRGACWGSPNYSQLVGIPDDRPAAGDSGECQSEEERSPVYQATPRPQRASQ
jgi:hypothetical protein